MSTRTKPKAEPTTRIEPMQLDELIAMGNARNPKHHELPGLIDSFRRFGFVMPPTIDEATSTLVAGHGRIQALAAMRAAGETAPTGVHQRGAVWFVPVIRGHSFANATERDAYLLSDNQHTINGGWNPQALQDLLAELAEQSGGLAGTGYDSADLDELLGELGDDDPDSAGREVPVNEHTRLIGHKVRPPVQMTNDDWVLHLGDCLEGLRQLADNSVDAVVTDPPAGISFMGRGWDSDKGGRDQWIAWLQSVMVEVHRVLKPGGHVLTWALPRTSHWTAMAVENAGFELRDVVYHAFAVGFPKSLNVSKAIDDRLGAERPVIGHRTDGVGNTEDSIHKQEGFAASREASFDVTGSATAAAAAWEGWGTALKPAVEPWIMARKPLEGSVAENVLKWGVGAVNVDATRVGDDPMEQQRSVGPSIATDQRSWGQQFNTEREVVGEKVGRWPAHFVLSHSAGCVPIGQVEDSHSVNVGDRIGDGQRTLEFGMGKMETTTTTTTKYRCVLGCSVRMLDEQSGAEDDQLGASRFFFVAKAPRAEKEAGLTGDVHSAGEATARKDGSAGLENPRAGAGRTGNVRNIHPTVKSISLMRWLVRLVSPPGALVLDPFCGSGTTGLAALVEGCRFLGYERDPEYHAIASERLRSIIEDPRLADEDETPAPDETPQDPA